jgi:hypothetical protein
MARTLSDTLIIAMIEAATRLAGGRGPIAGVSAGGQAAQTAQAGEVAAPSSTGATVTTDAGTPNPAPQGASPAGGGQDTRTAEQIGADFRTIYAAIEDVVKSSAEQETKPVGFGIR